MRDRFVRVPFASGGDVSSIPDATQPTGSISMQQGWGGDYQKEVGVEPGAKSVDRQDMNELFNIVTSLLNRWQTESFPEWIDPASNAGTPYPYPLNAIVRYSSTGTAPFVAWLNNVDGNVTAPSDVNGWVLLSSIIGLSKDPTETTRGAPLLATQVIAEEGSNNTAMMSALRVVQLIRGTSASASETLRGSIRIGTQAEANAGSSDSVALSPKNFAGAFKAPNLDLSLDGFQRLPSGVIIQWGMGASAANNANQTITFPQTFPNALFSLQVTAYRPATSPDDGFFTIGALTNSSFVTTMHSSLGEFRPNWVAIGC